MRKSIILKAFNEGSKKRGSEKNIGFLVDFIDVINSIEGLLKYPRN